MGRPTQYTQEWLEEEAEAFIAWMKKPRSIYFKTFAIERGYSPTRLHEFAKMNDNFSRAMEYAAHWQEQKLLTTALYNETNAGMAKFVLINRHDFSDKVTHDYSQAPPQSIPTSKDLTKDSPAPVDDD